MDHPVGAVPANPDHIRYDPAKQELHVGDGILGGVRPDVWAFRVGTLEPVARWLHQRTGRGSGRAATHPGPLDRIRPTAWDDDWNDELLDLVRCLTATLDLATDGAALLDRIVSGNTVDSAELPPAPPSARTPPRVPAT